MKNAVILFSMLFLSSSSFAADWAAWKYFVGDWAGAGAGKPGQSVGTEKFSFGAGDQILVRKAHSHYAIYKEQGPHYGLPYDQDSIMVIYQDHVGAVHAQYYDSETHAISYDGTVSGNQWVFLSTSPTTPQFRLTYTFRDDKTMDELFEFTNKEGVFEEYVGGTEQRE